MYNEETQKLLKANDFLRERLDFITKRYHEALMTLKGDRLKRAVEKFHTRQAAYERRAIGGIQKKRKVLERQLKEGVIDKALYDTQCLSLSKSENYINCLLDGRIKIFQLQLFPRELITIEEMDEFLKRHKTA